MNLIKTHIIHWPRAFTLFFFSILFLTGCAGNELSHVANESVHSCFTTSWAHEQSALKPDPNIHFGRLGNGVRYVLFPNKEPQNRVGLYLNVQAGSMHETEEQRGLAHYLEHLLFNGTAHFPPGELVDYFQSIGMGFGADTNAHTSYDETVYKLQLPNSKDATVDKGILVLADYARKALLIEEEVERERGVILSEKRSRDSVSSRIRDKQLQHEFKGTLIPERRPIGIQSVLNSASSADLRRFYDSWYRPENMVVVIVGAIDLEQAETLVKKHFSSLEGQGEKGVCPQLGQVIDQGTDVLYLYEPELGSTRVSIGTVYNIETKEDSKQWRRNKLHQYVATLLLQNRLEKITRQPDGVFTSANGYNGIFLQQYGYVTLAVSLAKESWAKGLAMLQSILDQALNEGFYRHELEQVRKNIEASLQRKVQTKDTRNSMALARKLVANINNNEVSLSPEQELEMYGPLIDSMSLEDVNTAFKNLWQHDRRIIQVIGTADLREQTKLPENIILEVLDQVISEEKINWQDNDGQLFPYLKKPLQKGQIVGKEKHDLIDVETFLLNGGVRLNIKKTSFQQNQVLLDVNFGPGKLTEPKLGMAMLAENVLEESGLGGLTLEQLKEALAGSSVSLGFNIEPQSFLFSGGSLTSDIELLFQLLYSYLHDPAFRQPAYERSRTQLHQMYEEMQQSVGGNLRFFDNQFFTGGSSFFSMPSEKQINAVSLEELRHWLLPYFQKAELEINVVGDVNVETVVNLVQQYFGQEKRSSVVLPEKEKINFPTGKERKEYVATSVDKALVTIAFQTDDFWNINRTRQLSILATVLKERLRKKLREEMGVVYSTSAYNFASRTHPGFGVMRSNLTVDPHQVDEITRIAVETALSLAAGKVTEDELQRALQPVLTSLRDLKRSNRYWLSSVLSLSGRYPVQLIWPATLMETFESVNSEIIHNLAKQYFVPGSEAVLKIVPEE